MHALTPKQVLRIWEEGQNQSLVQRSLIVLAHACPEEGWEALARLPVGERDSRLLALRDMTFGSRLSSVVGCPRCGERLELEFSVSDVRLPTPEGVEEVIYESDGFRIECRLPSSADLDGLVPGDEGRMQLILRCVTAASRNGVTSDIDAVPREHLEALADRIGEADPRADVKAELICPSCEHRWQAAFDIVSFFWEELGARARRLLRDVHVLASAYGWREDDVLALGAWRRQYYLSLVRQ